MATATEDRPDVDPKDDKKGKGKKEKGKGGKSNLVPAVVVALGLVAGGYFMGGRGGGSSSTVVTSIVEATSSTTAKPGEEVFKLDPLNLNLAGNHLLKVGVALQLAETTKLEAFEESGQGALVADLVIKTFGGLPVEEIANPITREELKKLLEEQVVELYEGKVARVYFTEFVWQ